MELSELQVDNVLKVRSFYNIDEIKDKTEEELQKELGKTFIELETKVLKVYRNGILVEKIKDEGGNVIVYDSEIVRSDLYKIEIGAPPIVWENVHMKRYTGSEGDGYLIASKLNGTKVNRRNNYRVSVGFSSIARLGISRKTANVIVHDVSGSGFSVIVDNESEVQLRDSIRVSYDDIGLRITLNGTCVRKKEIDGNRTLYGCRLDYPDNKINNYVAQKQRNKASG